MAPAYSFYPLDLFNRIGTADSPVLIDVRTDEDFASDSRLIPSSIRRPALTAADWAKDYAGRETVLLCQKGLKLSLGAAAWLRHAGGSAAILEGGFEAWRAAGLPLVPIDRIPARDAADRTIWVTRERPKIDRIACPWLIRRFVDPLATFLFAPADAVLPIAERFGATPFDIEQAFWSHRGENCSFDTMLEEFGLHSPALDRLAAIVRGADTAQLHLAPESAGLLAISLGLSRQYDDDLRQIEAGMALYDAFYLWCRDATEETHNWPALTSGRAA